MTTEIEQVDVIVVGTGWNGLIAAKTYLDFDASANLVLLDEQQSIGGVWSAEKIYPSLYAQIKYGLFEYSFYPMRREGISPDGYISGDTINTYLNDFAKDYELCRRTRLLHKVLRVDRVPVTQKWRVDIDGKASLECSKLIYASGATSHPVIPSWPTSIGFNATIIHSSETGGHLRELRNLRRATVVGAAKSAYDTVFLLLQNGVAVDWIIRENGTGPLAIMPPTILGIVNSMDVISTRALALFGSSIMNAKGPAYKFLQRTWLGRAFAKTFWKSINLIAELHAGYSKTPNAAKLRPLPHGNGVFWANAGLGCASVPDFWKVFHSGHCTVHRTEIESLGDGNTVSLQNGTDIQTEYVILCTGFDKSYQPFSPELQRQLGLATDVQHDHLADLDARAEISVDNLFPSLARSPVPPSTSMQNKSNCTSKAEQGTSSKAEQDAPMHGPSLHYRRLVVPALAAQGDRSIYFPGFIHTIYTPLVAEVQALWGVAFLQGLVNLPTQEHMEQEVAEWNVWCRKRYLAQGRKHAYAIYDFLSYIDTLLKDLGINTVRRKNPISNLLLPYYPSLYRGLVDEFKSVSQSNRSVEEA